jgi:helix-turn-helix protein
LNKLLGSRKKKGHHEQRASTKAARLDGQPQRLRRSRTRRGQFRGISERKLMDCLTRLGRDVQINVRHAPKKQGRGVLSVVFS